MIAAHRGHAEMVFMLLHQGKANTQLVDAYGKKALDRTKDSHISYLIAQASISNRMKEQTQSLNLKEYSPERRGHRDNGGGESSKERDDSKTPTSKGWPFKSTLTLTSGKKKRPINPTSPSRMDPKLQAV